LKLFEVTIRLTGALGTPLKGDTLFGHFCWQAAYDNGLLNGGLEKWLRSYGEAPFAVFSSAFPKLKESPICYAMKRPDIPLWALFPKASGDRKQRIRERKEIQKKRWVTVEEHLLLEVGKLRYLSDKDLLEEVLCQNESLSHGEWSGRKIESFKELASQPHNTINRLSGATGTGQFAPYSNWVTYFEPQMTLVILVMLDGAATDIDRMCVALARIGQTGFGKDASIGMGRFDLLGQRELGLPRATDVDALYCLSPCVPEPESFAKAFFTPFTRFGKHGDRLARSQSPFKAPVIMADEGAVFVPPDHTAFQKPYFGRAVIGGSKALNAIATQGYSIWLPFKGALKDV